MSLRFDVITLFPELFNPFLKRLPIRKAVERDLIEIRFHNLKEFAVDKRGTVDDKPYGGGVGMVLMIEPIYKALKSIQKKDVIIALSPAGEKYSQKTAQELAKRKQITLICGRYEGMDERIMDKLATKVISIGDYVLSGGEIPALTVIESVSRLMPGVLEKEEASINESFSDSGLTEYPQYTRPENFKGMEVPKVLLSGNHKEIKAWRDSQRKNPQ